MNLLPTTLALASLTLSQSGGTPKAADLRPPLKLSPIQKRQVIQAKAKTLPGGLTDYAQVTVLKPVVPGKAWLYLSNASVNFEEGHSAHSGQTSAFTMSIKVIRPGKIHLVTFYLNLNGEQRMRMEARQGGSMPFASDNLQVKPGPQAASLVFTPTKAGRCSLRLFSLDPYTFHTFSAECTVVD